MVNKKKAFLKQRKNAAPNMDILNDKFIHILSVLIGFLIKDHVAKN